MSALRRLWFWFRCVVLRRPVSFEWTGTMQARICHRDWAKNL